MQEILKYLPEDAAMVVAIFIAVVFFVVKIVYSLPHINEFLERRNKSKAEKIKQALKSPNLSNDVKAYLQDKLTSEYFYRATGILAIPKNIDKIINIHNGDNNVKDFHFKRASVHANYQGLDIEINTSKIDKFLYYFDRGVFWVAGSFWVLIMIFFLISLTDSIDSTYQDYIMLLLAFILFSILFIFSFKNILSYESARRIQQHLKNQTKEK